jgi:hypothetical protein
MYWELAAGEMAFHLSSLHGEDVHARSGYVLREIKPSSAQ